MITGSRVYLREMTSTLNLVEQVINHEDIVLINEYDFVLLHIVNTHFDRTVFIFHK